MKNVALSVPWFVQILLLRFGTSFSFETVYGYGWPKLFPASSTTAVFGQGSHAVRVVRSEIFQTEGLLTALSGVENRVDPAEDQHYPLAKRREDTQCQNRQNREHQRVLDQGLPLLPSRHDSAKIAAKGLKQGSHLQMDSCNSLSQLRSPDNRRENFNHHADKIRQGT
jgi:hypothetical protein